MTVQRILAAAASLALGLSSSAVLAGTSTSTTDPLIVHEWGTFTVLQDEHGRAIGGINTDDEPVPDFVHTLHGALVQNPSQLPPIYAKGWPRCDQDVTVRLETPVIYFHPPRGGKPLRLDVEVTFNGGWLTQFYPDAKATAPGLRDDRVQFGVLNAGTAGSLSWRDLTVGSDRAGPETHERVWTAPRAVDAASVSTLNGESERYLFYRGVGHLNAPLQVSRDPGGERLSVRTDGGKWVGQDPNFTGASLWLVDVRDDGTCAVRSVHSTPGRDGPVQAVAELPAAFSAADYRADNLAVIRRELKAALVAEGLYDDEADGLLNTWEVSYFRRPGQRLFFMVPQVWTQRYLPLRLSQTASISRAMVGRIELVTPRHHDLLRQIAKGPASSPRWLLDAMQKMSATRNDRYREDWYRQALEGQTSLASMRNEMPADYRAYLDLGRFRNALILDEQKTHPSPVLEQFIKNYELGGGKKE